MIRGYFLDDGERTRPFVDARFNFRSLGTRLAIRLLVDTGADRTVIGAGDAWRLGIDLTSLPAGPVSTGVGGRSATRILDAVVRLGPYAVALPVPVLVPPGASVPVPSMPSLLGRDILANFALFVEERTGRVLLLNEQEASALALP